MPWDGIGDSEVAVAEAFSGKGEYLFAIAVVDGCAGRWVVNITGCNVNDALARVVIDDPSITGAGGSRV